jgi:hypothetical protein
MPCQIPKIIPFNLKAHIIMLFFTNNKIFQLKKKRVKNLKHKIDLSTIRVSILQQAKAQT